MTDNQEPASTNKEPASIKIPEGPSLASDSKAEQGEIQSDHANKSGNESHIGFADFHQQYVSGYIHLADAKAGATLTVISGVLAYLLTWDVFIGAITTPADCLPFVVSAFTSLLLVCSASMAFWTIVPRQNTSGDGFVFWGSVAALPTSEEFVRKVTGSDVDRLVNERLRHCYDISRVCSLKYKWLRRSMLCGAVGIIAAYFTRLVL